MEDGNQPNDQAQANTEAPAIPDAASAKKLAKVTYDGFEFDVDTELIDDVKVLKMIDQIEAGNRPGVILDFLEFLIGKAEYEKMEAYFVAKDGKFALTKLTAIYKAIFENFDPKDLLS